MMAASATMDALLERLNVELDDAPEALLGQGPGGFVRRGSYGGTGCAVKVRVVEPAGHTDSANAAAAPSHPHLVHVLARLSRENTTVEVRSLCEGGELFDQLVEMGAMGEQEAVDYFAQALAAMSACHTMGIASGQIRPEHLLLSRSGHLKLLGFDKSRCRPVAGLAPPSVRLRRVLPLDAPELHEFSESCECPASALPPADVWCVAMHLVSMLAGEPPFSSTKPGVCARYGAFVGSGLSALNLPQLTSLRPELREVLGTALSPRPSERPTATEILSKCFPAELAESALKAIARHAEPVDLPPEAGSQTKPLPPVRPTGSAMKRLGWEGLPFTAPSICKAVETTLIQSHMPHSVDCERFLFFDENKFIFKIILPVPDSSPSANAGGASAASSGSDAAPPTQVGVEASTSVFSSLDYSKSPLDCSASMSLDYVNPGSLSVDLSSHSNDHVVPYTGSLDRPPLATSLAMAAELSNGSSPPLVVYIQILRESQHSPRHDLQVRRVQGTTWHFQSFYTSFRNAIAKQLGLSNYQQLSLFSPFHAAREPARREPSLWFSGRAGMSAPAPAPAPAPAAASASGEDTAPDHIDKKPRFQRRGPTVPSALGKSSLT